MDASFTVALAEATVVGAAPLVGLLVVELTVVVGDADEDDLLLLPHAASAKAATPVAANARMWD